MAILITGGILVYSANDKGVPPVAQWKFNEGSGNYAYDSSGNGNTGSLVLAGSATSSAWVSGVYGSALQFDGSDDYVSVGSGTSMDVVTAAYSISFWAKFNAIPTTEGSFMELMYKGLISSKGFSYCLFKTGGTLYLNLAKAGIASQLVAYAFSTGVWYHITAVQNFSGGAPSTVTYYVNGVNVGSSSVNTTAYQSSVGYTAYIGANVDYPSALPMSGLIDDVRIYNYALTPVQIKTLFNQGAAVRFGPTEGLP